MSIVNVNGQKAIRVTGKVIRKLDKASLIDFEGDELWCPNSAYREDKTNNAIDVQEWFYNQKLK